jgi:histidinol-phosphate aminotransferase
MHYLDRNEYQFDLPEKCLQVLQNSPANLLTHYSRTFERHMQSRITERLAADYGIPEKNILLGYGCEDLLKQIVHHFVKKGDGVLVAQYAWWYFKKIASEVEGVTREFPVHMNETRFHVDLQDILDLHDRFHPKLIILANPNNPTGDAMEVKDLEVLIQRCPDTQVVLDESYWGYHDAENAHVRRFMQNYPNAVVLRTFSKFFGLAGVRIGFGFIHPEHDIFIRYANRYLGFNRLSEELVLSALDSFDHFKGVARLVDDEKQRYYRELRLLPGVRAFESKANFILIAVPEKTVNALKANFKKSNILVRFFEDGGLENHFRVSIAKPEINAQVIRCIQEAVARP